MKKIINNIVLSINKETDGVNISASSVNKTIFQSTIPIEEVSNNFYIPKVKNFELLNILSSNFTKESNKNTYIKIKIYQIKHNLKTIVNQTFKYNTDYIDLINIDNIEVLLNEIQYRYSNKETIEYIKDDEYLKLINKTIFSIKKLISFLIDSNAETRNIVKEIFLVKNFNSFAIFETPLKKLSNNILKKQTIFFTYKNEKYENILPYENIYTFPKGKKLITYKFHKERKRYIVYYTYNLTTNDKKILKKHNNNRFTNLNRLFENNVDFNTTNTKFTQLKTIHINRIFIEKMLLELSDSDNEEDFFDENLHKPYVRDIIENNDVFPVEEEDNEKYQEDIIKQINNESDSIFIHHEEFDKDIEDKIFF